MTPYDMIKSHLDTAVPFANHVGVRLAEIGDGTASAELDQREDVSNHIATMRAGAMFTLGEAASGAALAGAFGMDILKIRPVAVTANILCHWCCYVTHAQRLSLQTRGGRPGRT